MNLILWRHAEAEDYAASDLARPLTPRGQQQAQAVAQWLQARLDPDAVVLASPALRTRQTAQALSEHYRVVPLLAPDASVAEVLSAAGWADGSVANTVVIVGHQPTLGHVAAHLLAGERRSWPLQKAGLWWLQHHMAGTDQGASTALLHAALTPDQV
ncbi:histidine phosphatase family protein [Paraburkholderia bonniea]|uniref:SixA phosphatase family protein n=1 Tax=Paraburkholderia bonniea TaxID=2152891 RepID=UPI001290A39F|nr:histidine phosphatase family protein [Paraburkholderia bonniea]WJF89434.1 histidine phosphatase family protein [Paraburkholderia bonniea]WJF92749.1 histidine phosphatase family protein [Paraburkholderia bonniea]